MADININAVFRRINGTTVMHYVGREKVLRIDENIQKKRMTLEVAREEVDIRDVSYGYRHFKRYMGVTPGTCRNRKVFRKNKENL